MQAIATGWPDDPKTLPLLHDHAANDPGDYGNVRYDALVALTNLSPAPDTESVARELMSNEFLSFNHNRIQRLITIIWPEEPVELSD